MYSALEQENRNGIILLGHKERKKCIAFICNYKVVHFVWKLFRTLDRALHFYLHVSLMTFASCHFFKS